MDSQMQKEAVVSEAVSQEAVTLKNGNSAEECQQGSLSKIEEPQEQSKSETQRRRASHLPSWKVWKSRTSVRLWEAIALSMNITPSWLDRGMERFPAKAKIYRSRLKTARSWLNIDLQIVDHPDNGDDGHQKMVRLADYVACALAKGQRVTQGLQDITEEARKEQHAVPSVEQPDSQAPVSAIAQRNAALQEAAEKLANELSKKTQKKVTRRAVAKALSEVAEWCKLTPESIERIIRATWDKSRVTRRRPP